MKSKYIEFRDANDMLVFVSIPEVNKVLTQESLTLFGLDLKTICKLKHRYHNELKETVNAGEVPSDFTEHVYAIGNKKLSRSSYKSGPTSNADNLLSELGNSGDAILDITKPKDPIVKYIWSFASGDWDKVDINFNLWRSME